MFFLELHVSTIDYRKSVPSAVAELISMMTTYDEVDPTLSRSVLTCYALGDHNSHPVITDQKSRLVVDTIDCFSYIKLALHHNTRSD